MDLFRKKSVDQLVAESTPLKRTMRTFDLTMLGIGAIIGTGIFVLTGKGALTAGPALSVSFLLAAVCCGFAGLCYAEFAAMAPVSGSAYSYAYLAFGELIAFVIGWDLILEYALQAATVSAGWSGYFNKLLEGFGLHLPVELTAAYGTTPGVTTYFNLPGFVIVLIITWVLSIGINQTKRTNDVMVLIKLAIIVLFIVCAVWYVKPSNWQPFSPYGIYTFQPGSTQPYGIVPAASIVFFSFIGFDAVSSSAEETVNPNKTLPRGILLSLAISTVLYVIMTMIMTGVVPYKEFAKYIDAPVAGVILETGMNWLAVIVNLGALIGMTTVMLVQLYGQSRICYAMSRDGLFPEFFGHVHEKYRTPVQGHVVLRSADRVRRRLHQHQRAVRAGEHRHPVRVHHRVGRYSVDAQDPAGRAPRLPRPGRTGHADSGHRVLLHSHRRPQLGDLGAFRRLVRFGPGSLLRLQSQALQAWAGRQSQG